MAVYTREESDAKFETIRAEIREECGKVHIEMAHMKCALVAMIERLRGEMKIWYVVGTAIVIAACSGLGSRLLNQVWPVGPGPAGVSAPAVK